MNLQPISKDEWIHFLREILRPQVMRGGYGDQPEGWGHLVTPEQLGELPQGSGLYKLLRPTGSDISLEEVFVFADTAGSPEEGWWFGYADGSIQVLTDLNNPDHTYTRVFSLSGNSWNYWYNFSGPLKLPTTLEQLEQTLRI